MIYIKFQNLTIDDKPRLDPFFNDNYHENAHLNFTNLFIWRKPYNIQWCIEDDILYLKASYRGHTYAIPPVCSDEKIFEALDKYLAYFQDLGEDFMFYGLEQHTVDLFKEYPRAEFEFSTNRDEYDYVYNSQDLIKLAGRKFHSKKNHLNSFRKNYPEAQYMPINDEIITLCKITINGWYKKRLQETPDDEFIGVERDAIIEVFNNFEKLKLKGGALFLVNKVMAFTFGEKLNDNMAVIHVEKADPDVNGAYTAINQAFVEHEWSDVEFINREEDMGIPGLRKAKESYRPVKLVEKFMAKVVATK